MSNKVAIGYRPTWAEVNLNYLGHNFKKIKSLLHKQTKVLVTVKADAYGHGLIPVAKKLVACGLDYLGVASIDEGIKLRRAGIKKPILILGLVLKEDIKPLFTYRLIPAVCDLQLARALNAQAGIFKQIIPVHIKIDTGMGRIGVLPGEAFGLVTDIYKLKNIQIQGIFTHFPLADSDHKFTTRQIRLFDKLVMDLKKSGINIPLVHTANSIGLIKHRNSHFNMVRPGLVIYGLHPKKNLGLKLKPVLSLKTRVVFIKQVGPHVGISYGLTYVTARSTCIVTLPIGYGDGYPRNLSNLGWLLIGGRRFRVSGRVCMDQIMVDVGNFKPKIGDEVVLIGKQGEQQVTAEELAELSGTISYEIVCGLGSRIPRIYINEQTAYGAIAT
ncbi:MAG: alanine racemase [Candidatus Omnitrophica bacterium]|nr:alanine racemase [Candidatus Omnitrophota bacterium]